MNTLMIALQTIAMLCGPRVQTGGGDTLKEKVKDCQIQMLKCVQAKVQTQTMNVNYEGPLSQCVQEIK